jgi:hypothetical protein
MATKLICYEAEAGQLLTVANLRYPAIKSHFVANSAKLATGGYELEVLIYIGFLLADTAINVLYIGSIYFLCKHSV